MKKLTFIFKEDGTTVTVDADGYQGTACVSDVEKILKNQNAKLVKRTFKEEYSHVTTKNRANVQG